jgi:hypothetical protein
MKVIVFNLLEEVVRRERGENVWDALLEATSLHGSFTSLGSYADEDFSRLVAAAAAQSGQTPGDVLRWFGRLGMPRLAERYPEFFRSRSSVREFLLTLNDIIHTEVRKLYPDAHVPMFDFDTADAAVLRMGYRSDRRLCALAEGFIEGAAACYGETVTLRQEKCLLRGDDKCLFEIRFVSLGG